MKGKESSVDAKVNSAPMIQSLAQVTKATISFRCMCDNCIPKLDGGDLRRHRADYVVVVVVEEA